MQGSSKLGNGRIGIRRQKRDLVGLRCLARQALHIKIRITVLIFGLSVFLLTATGWGRAHKKPTSVSVSDPDYVVALATANRFLHAWQTGDLNDGMVLVSDGIRHSQNAPELEQFFSAATDRAFEIGAGRGTRGRYSFPVVLVSVKEGTGPSAAPSSKSASSPTLPRRSLSRRTSEIILVNAGKNDWVVDKLP
ncbi:MAG: hypothetical protein WAU58_07410 [Terriglobales bacterium]